MKRLLILVVGVVAALAALMLISGLAIRMMISGSARDAVLGSLEERLEAPIAIEGGDFDLMQWFLFQPSITLRGFSIGNPEGFSSGNMLQAEEVSAQVSLFSLFSDRMEVHSIILRRPQFQVETDAQGQSNLGVLVASLRSQADEPTEEDPGTELAVHGLYLEDAAVRYLQAGETEPLTVSGIGLELTDFAPDTSCRFRLTGRPFGGDNSRIQFEGKAGPFGDSSFPAQGEMQAGITPAEVPLSIRQKYFGTILAEPTSGSHIDLSANVEGDLFTTLRGKGELRFVDFQVGPDPQNHLGLAGEAPLDLTVQHLLGEPAFHLAFSGASLQLGSGQWEGNTEFHFASSQLKGYVNGAISNIDIREFLNAFSDAKDKLFGTAQMPELQISFSGQNPEELLDSLSGRGTLTMENGRIAVLDVAQSVLARVEKVVSGDTPASGETEFVRFFSRWQIGGRRLQMSDILLESKASDVSGEGFVTFQHELDFDLQTTVRSPLVAKIGGKPNSEGVPTAQIPVDVTGTLEDPRVRPDFGQIAKEQIKERVGGLLDSLLKSTRESDP